jgi:protein-S-isoprenylcysteine O-methyltransferase Ste14
MQVVGALLIVDMIRNVGLLRLSGIEQAIGYLRGAEHFPAIEAQGPRYESGAVKITGAFHYTRHPENLGLILLFAAVPRMTVNRLILACFATLYSIAGSLHEDQRLDLAYGESFQRYRRRVPMLLPMSKGLPRNKREW